MPVRVQIPTPMRQHTEGQSAVEASGATVKDVLDSLAAKYPAVTQRLFDGAGKVKQFVNLYLNDEDVRYLDNLATPVKDGDELAIIPAVAGG
jgi:molybdopterin synthase sulfur carrier subunit